MSLLDKWAISTDLIQSKIDKNNVLCSNINLNLDSHSYSSLEYNNKYLQHLGKRTTSTADYSLKSNKLTYDLHLTNTTNFYLKQENTYSNINSRFDIGNKENKDLNVKFNNLDLPSNDETKLSKSKDEEFCEFSTNENYFIDQLNDCFVEKEIVTRTFNEVETDLENKHDTIKESLALEVSSSLVTPPDLKRHSDSTRVKLIKYADEISKYDPEFILKMALYARQELNIRATANFLLAYAATSSACCRYVKRYYVRSVQLPSDWVEVALFCKSLTKTLEKGLPSCLRRVMVDKFSSFDEFQLAKYNKVKSFVIDKFIIDKDSEDMDFYSTETVKLAFKTLIRSLHISRPVNAIMCILGKRYPLDREAFRATGLVGTFEESRVGKRMKLDTPITWETQVSANGNTAEIWQYLIDNKKLPYMALLRNLGNLLRAGVQQRYHAVVLRRLADPHLVVNSRQTAFQYMAALLAVERLRESFVASRDNVSAKPQNSKNSHPIRDSKRAKKEEAIKTVDQLGYDLDLLKSYTEALETCISISVKYNLPPIPGRTVIVISISNLSKQEDKATLLALLCRSCCEDCVFLLDAGGANVGCSVISSSTFGRRKGDGDGVLGDGGKALKGQEVGSRVEGRGRGSGRVGFLEDLKSLRALVTAGRYEHNYGLHRYLNICTDDKFKIDNLLVIADRHDPELVTICRHYRLLVNNELIFANIVARPTPASDGMGKKDLIFGFSDQVLRFISATGDKNLVGSIENVHLTYNLTTTSDSRDLSEKVDTLSKPKLYREPRSLSIRVFVSSPFLDFGCERDAIVRCLIPRLAQQRWPLQIHLAAVDFRWGISETSSERITEICLQEVKRSHIFLCLLGERYGAKAEKCLEAQSSWLRDYDSEASLTELEVEQAFRANIPSLFYFREPGFLRDIPEHQRHLFESENSESKVRIAQLKQKIREREHFVVNYSCHYEKSPSGRVQLVHLDDLFKSISIQIGMQVKTLCESALMNVSENDTNPAEEMNQTLFDIRLPYLVSIKKSLGCKILLISGKEGIGKSFVLGQLHAYLGREEKRCIAVKVKGHLSGGHQLMRYLLWKLNGELLGCDDPSVPDNDRILEQYWIAALECLQRKVFLLIDGIDACENLIWIPDSIGKNLTVIATCDSSACVRLEASLSGRCEVVVHGIGSLTAADRKTFVSTYLRQFGKELSENGFSAQMPLLINKNDAELPLYLKIACDHLKVTSVYEHLTKNIRGLSESLTGLIGQRLAAIEMQLDCSETVKCWQATPRDGRVAIAVNVIYICEDYGISERDLRLLIDSLQFIDFGARNLSSIVDQLKSRDLVHSTEDFSFIDLVSSISHLFTILDNGNIAFTSRAIRLAIKSYYHGNGSKDDNKSHARRLVAALYTLRLSQNKECNLYACRLPIALIQAGYTREYMIAMTDLSALSRRLTSDPSSGDAATFILRDFDLSSMTEVKFVTWRTFFRRHVTSLNRHPLDIYQLIVNDVQLLLLYSVSELTSCLPDYFKYFKIVLPSDEGSKNGQAGQAGLAVQASANVHLKRSVSCVALFNERSAIIATFDGQLIHYDLIIGSIVSKVKVTSGQITSLGIIYDGCHDDVQDIILVCGGADGIAHIVCINKSISKVLETALPATLVAAAHGKIKRSPRKAGCISYIAVARCANRDRFIVVTSLAGDVFTYKYAHGTRKLHLLANFDNPRRSPVNCAAISVNSDLTTSVSTKEERIAIGDWNGEVRMYSLVDFRKVAVLKDSGSSSSVTGLTFIGQSSGNYLSHLVIAYLDGNIRIWSADSASLICKFLGHQHPIKSLGFLNNALFTTSDNGLTKQWSSSIGQLTKMLKNESNKVITAMAFFQDSMILIGYDCGHFECVNTETEKNYFEMQLEGSIALIHVTPQCNIVIAKYFYVGFRNGKVVRYNNFGREGVVVFNPSSDTRPLSISSLSTSVKGSERYLVSASYADGGNVIARLTSDFDSTYDTKKACKDVGLVEVNVSKAPDSQDYCIVYTRLFKQTERDGDGDGDGDTMVARRSHSGERNIKLLLASEQGTIGVWEIKGERTPLFTHLFTLEDCHTERLNCCVLLDDFRFCISGSSDFNLKLWDLKERSLIREFKGHKSAISKVVVKHDRVVSSGVDGVALVWTAKGDLVCGLGTTKCDPCTLDLRLPLDSIPNKGIEIVFADRLDHCGYIWSISQLSIQKRYTSHPSHIPVSHCSGDSGDMLMCSTAGNLELYSDLSSNIGDNLQTTLRTLPMSHNHEIGQLTAVNDDLLISISRLDRMVRIWWVNSANRSHAPRYRLLYEMSAECSAARGIPGCSEDCRVIHLAAAKGERELDFSKICYNSENGEFEGISKLTTVKFEDRVRRVHKTRGKNSFTVQLYNNTILILCQDFTITPISAGIEYNSNDDFHMLLCTSERNLYTLNDTVILYTPANNEMKAISMRSDAETQSDRQLITCQYTELCGRIVYCGFTDGVLVYGKLNDLVQKKLHSKKINDLVVFRCSGDKSEDCLITCGDDNYVKAWKLTDISQLAEMKCMNTVKKLAIIGNYIFAGDNSGNVQRIAWKT